MHIFKIWEKKNTSIRLINVIFLVAENKNKFLRIQICYIGSKKKKERKKKL